MKFCAIITEFNPFTNGHRQIIQKTKEKTGLNILCLMSGNLVQRGELALLNKYDRAKVAVNNGASIVMELPLIYALSPAEKFAEGAIKYLNTLGFVSHLSFGVETKNIDLLTQIAKLKVKESLTVKNHNQQNNKVEDNVILYKDLLKQNIKNGDNYSVANYKAMLEVFKDKQEEIKEIFNGANNILALEYLTALYKTNSKIEPVFIERTDNGFNSNKPKKHKENNKTIYFASASYIRNLVYRNKTKQIKKYVPYQTYQLVFNQKININDRNNRIDAILLSKLSQETSKTLENYYDYNQSIASLIYNKSRESSSMNQIIEKAQCKSYRQSRIRKLLFEPYLGITKAVYNSIDKTSKLKAINVLAVSNEQKNSLKKLIEQSKVKLVVSSKDYNNLDATEKTVIDINQKATDLYNIANKNAPSQDKTIFI